MPLAIRHRFYVVLPMALAAGWLWLLVHLFLPEASLSVCLFRKLTGFPCPSCGSTRAALALFQGKVSQAFSINPVSVPVLLIAITATLWLVGDLVKSNQSLYRFYDRSEGYLRKHPIALFVFFCVISLNWIWILCQEL